MGAIFLREARLPPQHLEVECKCILHTWVGLFDRASVYPARIPD